MAEPFRCPVCGDSLSPTSEVGAKVLWLDAHQHSRIERDAARIVQAAERRIGRWT